MNKMIGYLIIYLVILFVLTVLYASKGLGLIDSVMYSMFFMFVLSIIFFLLRLALHLIESPN